MDSDWLSSNIVIYLFLSMWSTHNVHCQSNIFTVTEFGAISDAKTDSKQAFLNAWKKACASSDGSVSIPSGTKFVVSEVEFEGPCIGQTKLIVNGTLIAPRVPTPNRDYWIKIHNVNGLSVLGSGSGSGTLDGNGASYWQTKENTTITSLKLEAVKGGAIRDIHSVNSKQFHVGIHNCQDVTLTNLHVTAPGDSPNTDGIHIADSDSVRISGANIATGDDCISVGDGATNVNITGVSCGPGHGISIGSLGRYSTEKQVRSIAVTNCTLTDTQNGLRIKTFGPSPPGLASNITFRGITVNNVKNPILIDQHYCPHSECLGHGESSVLINSVKFVDVHGSSATPIGVKIDCSKIKPCQDIELRGVWLTFKDHPTTAACSSADVKFLGSPQLPSRCS